MDAPAALRRLCIAELSTSISFSESCEGGDATASCLQDVLCDAFVSSVGTFALRCCPDSLPSLAARLCPSIAREQEDIAYLQRTRRECATNSERLASHHDDTQKSWSLLLYSCAELGDVLRSWGRNFSDARASFDCFSFARHELEIHVCSSSALCASVMSLDDVESSRRIADAALRIDSSASSFNVESRLLASIARGCWKEFLSMRPYCEVSESRESCCPSLRALALMSRLALSLSFPAIKFSSLAGEPMQSPPAVFAAACYSSIGAETAVPPLDIALSLADTMEYICAALDRKVVSLLPRGLVGASIALLPASTGLSLAISTEVSAYLLHAVDCSVQFPLDAPDTYTVASGVTVAVDAVNSLFSDAHKAMADISRAKDGGATPAERHPASASLLDDVCLRAAPALALALTRARLCKFAASATAEEPFPSANTSTHLLARALPFCIQSILDVSSALPSAPASATTKIIQPLKILRQFLASDLPFFIECACQGLQLRLDSACCEWHSALFTGTTQNTRSEQDAVVRAVQSILRVADAVCIGVEACQRRIVAPCTCSACKDTTQHHSSIVRCQMGEVAGILADCAIRLVAAKDSALAAAVHRCVEFVAGLSSQLSARYRGRERFDAASPPDGILGRRLVYDAALDDGGVPSAAGGGLGSMARGAFSAFSFATQAVVGLATSTAQRLAQEHSGEDEGAGVDFGAVQGDRLLLAATALQSRSPSPGPPTASQTDAELPKAAFTPEASAELSATIAAQKAAVLSFSQPAGTIIFPTCVGLLVDACLAPWCDAAARIAAAGDPEANTITTSASRQACLAALGGLTASLSPVCAASGANSAMLAVATELVSMIAS